MQFSPSASLFSSAINAMRSHGSLTTERFHLRNLGNLGLEHFRGMRTQQCHSNRAPGTVLAGFTSELGAHLREADRPWQLAFLHRTENNLCDAVFRCKYPSGQSARSLSITVIYNDLPCFSHPDPKGRISPQAAAH